MRAALAAVEVIPEERLVYTWNGGSGKNDSYGHRLETTVHWALAPTAFGGTKLKLVHHGFRADDLAFPRTVRTIKPSAGFAFWGSPPDPAAAPFFVVR